MSRKVHTHNGMKFRHKVTGAIPELTQSEKAIVQLLEDEAMTIKKLADIRKCKESIIYRHLRNLKKKGVIFKYLILIPRSPRPKNIAPKHTHPLKPWKDPQSLFCSPRLKEIIKKEPANTAEIIAEE